MAVIDSPEKSGEAMRKINKSFRNKIRRHVKQGTGFSLEAVIGCDRDKLKAHIESKFEKDMSWNNYGSWWVINENSHKNVNFKSESEFMTYFNYTSYKPVWKKDYYTNNGGNPILKDE